MTMESQIGQFRKVGFFTSGKNAPIFLAQSDTTAGFLCSNFTKLNAIKGRRKHTNVLLTLDSFNKLKSLVRPPNRYKKRIRKSSENTFVYRGRHRLMQTNDVMASLAIRVVKPNRFQKASHTDFLRFFPFLYSSSANAHHQPFSLDFALQRADMVILDERGLMESKPSKIYKISNFNLQRIR